MRRALRNASCGGRARRLILAVVQELLEIRQDDLVEPVGALAVAAFLAANEGALEHRVRSADLLRLARGLHLQCRVVTFVEALGRDVGDRLSRQQFAAESRPEGPLVVVLQIRCILRILEDGVVQPEQVRV